MKFNFYWNHYYNITNKNISSYYNPNDYNNDMDVFVWGLVFNTKDQNQKSNHEIGRLLNLN